LGRHLLALFGDKNFSWCRIDADLRCYRPERETGQQMDTGSCHWCLLTEDVEHSALTCPEMETGICNCARRTKWIHRGTVACLRNHYYRGKGTRCPLSMGTIYSLIIAGV